MGPCFSSAITPWCSSTCTIARWHCIGTRVIFGRYRWKSIFTWYFRVCWFSLRRRGAGFCQVLSLPSLCGDLLWRTCSRNNYQVSFRTDTHVDALFIPAVIALLLYPLLQNQAARRWIPAWSFPIFLALEIVLLFARIPFFSTLQATVIPLLLLSTVLHPGSIPGRVLEMEASTLGRLDFLQPLPVAAALFWRQLCEQPAATCHTA